MNRIKKYLALTIAFILVVVSSTLLRTLAHGGDINQIHACVKNNNGSIRIVGANDTCETNERALDWRLQGEPGPAGPQGMGFGVTGRWEGTLTMPPNACSGSGTFDLIVTFVQDSAGNLTGSGKSDFDSLGTFNPAAPILGQMDQSQITFELGGGYDTNFQGALQDSNNLGGTISFPARYNCSEVGTWSAARVPSIP